MSDVQKMLDDLTAVDAAIAAGRYALNGEYRIAATLLQLAGALQAREPQPAPAPLTYQAAYVHAEDPTQVELCTDPHMPPHRRFTHPVGCATCSAPPKSPSDLAASAFWFLRAARRGRREGAQTAIADTAVIPLPVHESHAPTDCVFQIGGVPCGELIRWSDVNGWYHVQDRQLGAASHRATPGPTVGG